jgi:mRNA interferase MazF
MVYIPERGDLVWLTFDPQAGHEQMGRRPAITLSPASYNSRIGLALFCPITSKVKGYPFEVALPQGLSVQGVVLADQVKSFDWRICQATFIAQLPAQTLLEILQKLNTILTP